MYSIDRIEIERFRGREKGLTIPMDSKVNFFVGRNGTGKTTLMNLLNSALSADASGLAESDFQSVTFRLKRDSERKRPYIQVQKSVDSDGDPRFEYYIATSATAKPRHYVIHTGPASAPSMWHSMYPNRLVRRLEAIGDTARVVTAQISELINLSWISVHRSVVSTGPIPSPVLLEPDSKFQSPVDRKLTQVATDFVTYFSTLDKRAAEETDKFQQVYLLALISPSGFASLPSIESVNVDEEKAAIRGMFSEFNIRSSVYSAKLDSFTRRMAKAVANYEPNHALEADDFLVLTDTVRIHDAVKEWHKFLSERAKIYMPKDDFVAIVNELFYKKTLSINRGNQPEFTDSNSKPMKLENLSSGEKQLFILLGETLLQRRSACVFMADEPEISLHIDWQEKLVPSLRRINPKAQILFATHSPDVVGAYGENAIDLEKIL